MSENEEPESVLEDDGAGAPRADEVSRRDQPERAQEAYFRAIEETFIRLRGAPLLLSPADWRQAEQWFERGIPLDLVLATLELVFSRRAERGTPGRIQSLRYCAAAVDEAWEEVSALTAGGRRGAAPAIDVEARLAALASALPADLEDRETLAGRVRALRGTTAQVEAALAKLDGELAAGLEAALAPAEREALEGRLEAALAALGRRLSEAELSAARRRLLRQALRRERGVPVLSLFSPEAAAADRE